MCGIAGVYNPTKIAESDVFTVKRMIEKIRHRGPDDSGLFVNSDIVLGHALLSIIGVGGGKQPISNEDNTVWVTYNGEIYNFRQLKEDLIRKGHVFKTPTDSEVLVHLYEEYGPNFVERMQGMFAFAIWDANKKELMLARDRLGVKPLYWTQVGGSVSFCSELKGLTGSLSNTLEIDSLAIDYYLAFKSVGPDRSIYKNVTKVPPGTFMIFDGSKVVSETYWNPGSNRRNALNPAIDIPKLISDAVKERLVSDVPISISLSGGIDSSIVLYETAKQMGNATSAISVRYPNQKEDESQIAAKFAKSLGVNHTIIDFPELRIDELSNLATIMDEPFGDYSAYPSNLLFAAHRKISTVVLTGDGGDEAFGGYNRYIQAYSLHRLKRLNPIIGPIVDLSNAILPKNVKLQKLKKHIRSNRIESYESIISMMTREQRYNLYSHHIARDIRSSLKHYSKYDSIADDDNLEALLDYLHYLPADVLAKVDRTSMNNSVEVRSPFLDYRVVEYGLSLAGKDRFTHGEKKVSLRNAYRDKIPNEILDGKKRGFTVPYDYWTRRDFKEFAYDTLLSKDAICHSLFDSKKLSYLVTDAFSGKVYNPRHVWSFLMLELWLKHSQV